MKSAICKTLFYLTQLNKDDNSHSRSASYPHTFSKKRLGYCYRLRPSVRPPVRYVISSQTAGQNPTKFGEWLAYTSGVCKSTFIFGPAPRGPGEGSKGQILTISI